VPRYLIIDEPAPSAVSKLAVQPMWPLFALMFAGAWLAFPWFVLNAYAIGSIGRARQLAWAAAGFLGTALLFLGLVALVGAGVVPGGAAPYALLCVVLWKIAVGYALYVGQSPSFELHQYLGGSVRNGMLAVLVGAFWARPALGRQIEALAQERGGLDALLRLVLL
jgi:hypothetical protein